MCDEQAVERARNFMRRYGRRGIQDRMLRHLVAIDSASNQVEPPMTITAIQEATETEHGPSYPFGQLGKEATWPDALRRALDHYVAGKCTEDRIRLALASTPMPNDHFRFNGLLWLPERQLIDCVVVDETTPPEAALEELVRPPLGPALGGRPITFLVPHRDIAPMEHPVRALRRPRSEYILRGEIDDKSPRPQRALASTMDPELDLTMGHVLSLERSDVALVREPASEREETVTRAAGNPDLIALAHPTTTSADCTRDQRVQRTRTLRDALRALPPVDELLAGTWVHRFLPRETGPAARNFLLLKAFMRAVEGEASP